MKKLTLAILLGSAMGANAAMYVAPKCDAGAVTVPCEANAWDLGVDLLYLRNQETHRAVFATQNRIIDDEFRGDFGYGFRLEGSYHFGTGNDFSINWSHLSKDTTDTSVIDDAAEQSFETKMNVVNLEVGQHIDVGEKWNLRAHGGVQYAKLTGDLNPDTNANVVVHATFSGWGPRAGADSSYDFGNGFALFANAGLAVLNAKETIDVSEQANASASRYLTIVDTDMRAGAMYTHAMAQGDFTLRAGYQVNNFINADNGRSDVSVDGWFIGLKWVGNA